MLVDVDELDQSRIGFAFRLDHELDHVFLVIETVEQQRRAGIEGLRQTNVGRVTLHQVSVYWTKTKPGFQVKTTFGRKEAELGQKPQASAETAGPLVLEINN